MKTLKVSFCSVLLGVLLFNCTYEAYATGAEGFILGGGSLAGLSLTGPQTALIIAGLLGTAYTIDHADEIYDGMSMAINNAMAGVKDSAEKISGWWDRACSGVIDTASDVWGGICDWFDSTCEIETSYQCAREYKANTVISVPDGSYYANYDCLAMPYYQIYQSDRGWECSYGFFTWVPECPAGMRLYYPGGSSTYYGIANICGGRYQIASTFCGVRDSFQKALDCVMPFAETWVYCPDSNASGYLQQLVQVYDGPLPVAPAKVGGINAAIESGELTDVRDVVYPDAGVITLNPGIEADLPAVIDGVAEGTLTWEDYWERVTDGSMPGVLDAESDIVYELDNEGVSDRPLEVTAPANSALNDYKVDLTDIFPFCIPFDIYNFFNCLCAEPEAPKIKWIIPLSAVGLEDYYVEIDLKRWDSVAQLVRNMELLAFCVGLALTTRNLIRG